MTGESGPGSPEPAPDHVSRPAECLCKHLYFIGLYFCQLDYKTKIKIYLVAGLKVVPGVCVTLRPFLLMAIEKPFVTRS